MSCWTNSKLLNENMMFIGTQKCRIGTKPQRKIYVFRLSECRKTDLKTKFIWSIFMNECIVNTEFIRKLLVISHFRFKYWGCSEQWNRWPTPANYWKLNDNFFPTLYYLHQIMPALGQCLYSNYNGVSVIIVEYFITFEIIYLGVFLMFTLASLVLERWHCIKKKVRLTENNTC